MADSSRIEDLRRRVQRDPASIAFAQLAEEYRRGGHYSEAVETCRAGLALHPGYLSARVTLGRALLELGSLDDAQQELELVLRSAPENLAAIRGTAEIHQRRGDLPKALEYFKAALAFARNDPDLEETVNDLTKKLGHARRGPDTGDGLTLDQIQSIFAAHIPAAPSKPAPPVAPPAPIVLAPAPPPTLVAPVAPTVVVAPSAMRVESAIDAEPAEGAQAEHAEPVVEGEAERRSGIEHFQSAGGAEHLLSPLPSEPLEDARESVHPGRAFDSEHPGGGAEGEDFEGAVHTGHVESALEDARSTNSWSVERLEPALRSRTDERAFDDERAESAVQPDMEHAPDDEPPPTLSAVEYVASALESEHAQSAADREQPTGPSRIEPSESGLQTERADGAGEGEHVARTIQRDVEHAPDDEPPPNLSAVEYVESPLEPEHPQSAADSEPPVRPFAIEHAESGLQTERPDGAVESEHLARAVESEHVEHAFDDEHSTNLSPFEHFENALLAERAENVEKGEQFANSVDTEHHGSAGQEELLTIEKLERLLTGIYAVRADRRA